MSQEHAYCLAPPTITAGAAIAVWGALAIHVALNCCRKKSKMVQPSYVDSTWTSSSDDDTDNDEPIVTSPCVVQKDVVASVHETAALAAAAVAREAAASVVKHQDTSFVPRPTLRRKKTVRASI